MSSRPVPGLYLKSADDDKTTFINNVLLLTVQCCRHLNNIDFPITYTSVKKRGDSAFSEDNDNGFLACGLPCVVNVTGCIHSGLTASVRQIVLAHADQKSKCQTLLGYHANCLRSPAEISPWTYLCECTLPTITPDGYHQFLQSLELHLKSLMHLPSLSTVMKEGSESHRLLKPELDLTEVELSITNRTVVERKFIDHTDLTILDIIVFVFVLKVPANLFTGLPRLLSWYHRLWSIPALRQSAEALGYKYTVLDPSEPEDLTEVNELIEKKKKPASKKQVYDGRAVLEKLNDLVIEEIDFFSPDKVDWNNLPPSIHPRVALPNKRLERKIEQLDNLVQAVLLIAKPDDIIVDFCSGGGHLGLILAHLLPSSKIILIENKEAPLRSAVDRGEELNNIQFYQCNLTQFNGQFDIGVSLHACGSATDLVLDSCLRVGASFVLCPCCYGSIRGSGDLMYPRSDEYGSRVSSKEYDLLSRAADQTEFALELSEQGKECMRYLDWDRCKYAQACGYRTYVTTLVPPRCTPKNNLLIGTKGRILNV